MKIKTMKGFSILLWILILAGIDQIIKLVINAHYLHTNFTIIPSVLEFRPTFNYKYLYINSLFDLGDGFWIHLALFPVVAAIAFLIWSFCRSISRNTKWIDIGFTLICAGILSGLLCTVCWGGTLDYLYLKPLFVFDLKDVYLNGFAFFLVFHTILNRNDMEHLRFKDFIQHTKKLFKL